MGLKALDLLSRGVALIAEQFGATPFSIAGFGAIAGGQWNDIGRTEQLEVNGRAVSFSVMVEFPRASLPLATVPELLALVGKIVTRTQDGQTFRIVGEVAVDELAVRFPLESRHK